MRRSPEAAGSKVCRCTTSRTAVRSGDTPATERQRMISHPPHILITTPESLYILLTAERSRQVLKHAHTVIVDEIHAVAGDKRGAHLALSLERLDALAGTPLQRIGLSATQKPMDDIARLLVGDPAGCGATARRNAPSSTWGTSGSWTCPSKCRTRSLGPSPPTRSGPRSTTASCNRSRATAPPLVFVHTRRLVERVAHQLTDRLGEGKVLAHHGSLSRKTRLEAEAEAQGAAEVPVVVATASLELGIDIGPRRACLPHRCAALHRHPAAAGRGARGTGWAPSPRASCTRSPATICSSPPPRSTPCAGGELDRIGLVREPLDVLAQQMVATVASLTPAHKPGETLPLLPEAKPPPGIAEEVLWELVRGAYPFRNLSRGDFEQVLDMLCEGGWRRPGGGAAPISTATA